MRANTIDSCYEEPALAVIARSEFDF